MDLHQDHHRATTTRPGGRSQLDSQLPDEAVGLGRPVTPTPMPAVRRGGQVWIAASLPTAQLQATLSRRLVRHGFTALDDEPGIYLLRVEDTVGAALALLQRVLPGELAKLDLAVLSSELEPDAEHVFAELEPAPRALARLEAQWLVPMLAQRRLVTYLQPVFDGAGATYGEESLVRGLAPLGELIDGGRIFEAARDLELEATLDRMLVEQGIEAFASNDTARTRLFLNVSRASLERPDGIVAPALRAARHAQLSPGRVVLELSHADQHPMALVLRAVEVFRAAGFGVGLDDVGLSDTAEALVERARPDVVKLHQALVRKAPRSRNTSARVMGLVAAAEQVGARVVAKGIESTEELAQAQHLGVDLFQGFLLAHPRPGEL